MNEQVVVVVLDFYLDIEHWGVLALAENCSDLAPAYQNVAVVAVGRFVVALQNWDAVVLAGR